MTVPPLRHLIRLFRPEFGEIRTLLAFSIVVGLLTLATPIAVEALVNTVAFASEMQPILILGIIVLACLALAAIVLATEAQLVEWIQRRVFVRTATTLSDRLPRVLTAQLGETYGPELTNRFFEVPLLQKVGAKLLLDGVAVVMSASVGLVVLAFYHPLLLAFGALLIATMAFVLLVLGRGGIESAMAESAVKYATADWLEELMRHPLSFRYGRGNTVARQRGADLAQSYLDRRRAHYRIVFRQLCSILALQALMSTLLLTLGGFLVKSGELSLGQLVASWLLVSVVLGALAKFGAQLESVYDIVVSSTKLSKLLELPVERDDGQMPPNVEGDITIDKIAHPLIPSSTERPIDAHFEPGTSVAILGPSGAGKSTLLDLLHGLREPVTGRVEIDGVNLRSLHLDSVRRSVALVRRGEVIAGTVADNVRFGCETLDADGLRDALSVAGLWEAVQSLPAGTETALTSFGAPLATTHADRLVLARAVAASPSILMIDGLLDSLDDDSAEAILRAVSARGCTVIVATQRQAIANHCRQHLQLGPADHA